jgi:calcium-translocating P-type ATPase
MSVQTLSVKDVLKSLGSSTLGLSAQEAQARLVTFGQNCLKQKPRDPHWRRLIRHAAHLLALVLWTAALLCFVSYGVSSDPSMLTLGIVIIAVVILNATFSAWQESRAEKTLDALKNLLPHKSLVLRDNTWQNLATEDLVPGDVVEIREGDEVGADMRLIESNVVRVNAATITGESLPSSRTCEPCETKDLIQSKNVLLAGTRVVSGRGVGVVFATGDKTRFGGLAALTMSTPTSISPMQQEIRHISRIISWIAAALGIVFFVSGLFAGMPLSAAFIFGIGILVANVPEGLLPTVSLSLAMAAQRMSKRNVAIRHLPAVEALGQTTVVLTDKTGTLTENDLRVQHLVTSTQGSHGRKDLLLAMLHTHSLDPEAEVQSPSTSGTPSVIASYALHGDPLELALYTFARDELTRDPSVNFPRHHRHSEIPFDSARKRQSVLLAADHGESILLCKGAPEVVLARCSEFGEASDPKAWLLTIAGVAEQGFKVIAFAKRTVPQGTRVGDSTEGAEEIETGLTFLGFVALADPLRPEVAGAVAICQRAGVRVIMVTGDHPETARAICKQAGIFGSDQGVVIEGPTMATWTDAQLHLSLGQPQVAFARVRADQKLRITAALQALGEVVAVTGDGVNDAPALRHADVGIAMGRSGTDVARESASMVLLDDNFASIVAGIEEGRAVFANVRRFLTYILSSNIPEIVPYLCFALLGVPLPLTVIQILAIDLGTDMVPAVGLGAEVPAPGLMARPPKARGQRLLDGRLMLRAYLWLGLWEAAAAMFCFFFVLTSFGWQWGDAWSPGDPAVRTASSATFAAIVCMQVVNVFLCRREPSQTSWSLLPRNKIILWGVAIEIVLVLVLTGTPGLNEALGIAPLPAVFWTLIAPCMALMAVAEMLRMRLVGRN